MGGAVNGDISFFTEASAVKTIGNTFDYAANTKLMIKESGNVGIGTTSPNNKLEVVGASGNAQSIRLTAAVAGGEGIVTQMAERHREI